MRIAVIGGGPGGLYFAALAKRFDPAHEITVWERNTANDSSGFGIIVSDWSLGGVEDADPVIDAAVAAELVRWDDITVHVRGEAVTSHGHRLAAMSRPSLLRILQRRCADLGVDLRFRSEAPSIEELSESHDLVVAADGGNSATRAKYADVFKPDIETSVCKYMWLGTDRVFDAFGLHVVETPYGLMQIHAYPYGTTGSTFIVDMHERVWRAAGFGSPDLRPGESDEESVVRLGELFADILDGHRLIASNSRWTSFATVRNSTWRNGNVALLGDAAHTAHYSIGPGIKLALEDAMSLAGCLRERPDVVAALESYEAARRPVADAVQRASQASLEWFEHIDQFADHDPLQLAFNFLTRSRRVGYDDLRRCDPEFVDRVGALVSGGSGPPMFQPFRLRGLTLKNRVIVSSMGMFRSVEGTPGDFHLVHLGSKALGGAGLVMTEMVCVSPAGRVTPWCGGMYTAEHETAWRRIADFVHADSTAAIGLQLGHSGRKGSVATPRRGADHEPLPEGNWEVVAPSPIPYRPGTSQIPRELTAADADEIREQFGRAARMGAAAGFDLLELHCGHGYLLSSFISPLTNRRTDGYGGSLANRLRFPAEVVDVVRAAWPDERPLTVRISATDWADGGIGADDAVEIARVFAAHGADAIHVSTGQVTPAGTPAYGPTYQVPFAERIRNEAGVPTIAVGGISAGDDVNSIILAGRADLCALGTAHLFDPQWTLHAAADQEYTGPGANWPDPFKPGSRRPRRRVSRAGRRR